MRMKQRIVGEPPAGTPLMLCHQRTGIAAAEVAP